MDSFVQVLLISVANKLNIQLTYETKKLIIDLYNKIDPSIFKKRKATDVLPILTEIITEQITSQISTSEAQSVTDIKDILKQTIGTPSEDSGQYISSYLGEVAETKSESNDFIINSFLGINDVSTLQLLFNPSALYTHFYVALDTNYQLNYATSGTINYFKWNYKPNMQKNPSSFITTEVRQLTITSASTTTENVTITLNSVAISVPVTSSGNISTTLHELSSYLYPGWTTKTTDNSIIFTSNTNGAKSGVYSLVGTTIAGSFNQLRAGSVTDTIIRGFCTSTGNIRDVVGMRLYQPRVHYLAAMNTTAKRVSVLIEEFSTQSFIGENGRRFHFLLRPELPATTTVELSTEDYNDGIYSFRKPITTFDTLTISFGDPLQLLNFPYNHERFLLAIEFVCLNSDK